MSESYLTVAQREKLYAFGCVPGPVGLDYFSRTKVRFLVDKIFGTF